MKFGIAMHDQQEFQALKKMLLQAPLHLELVFSAFGGAEAVRQFRLFRPSLFLVDAQLGQMEVFETIQCIQRIDTEAEVILFNAPADFGWLLQGLRARIFDYLPIDEDDNALLDAIKLAERKIRTLQEKHRQDVENDKMYAKVEQYLKSSLFDFIISSNRTKDSWSIDFLGEYFHLDRLPLFCALIHTKDTVGPKTWDRLERELQKAFRLFACQIPHLGLLCVLPLPEPNRQRFLLQFSELVRLFFAEAELQVEWDLQQGETSNFRELPDVFSRLCEGLAKNSQERKFRSKQVLIMYELEEKLFRLALHRKWESVRLVLWELADKVDQLNDGDLAKNRAYFSYIWRQMDRYAFQMTGRRKSTDIKLSIDTELNNAFDLEGLVNAVMDFLRRYIDALGFDEETVPVKAIERVREYIDTNLEGDLSLEQVAQAVGISSFYLSKLFRKITGVNFKNYVIQTRMEKAKRLLSAGNRNIKEVAQMVGYSDVSYFSRAFKEFSGISAREFSGR